MAATPEVAAAEAAAALIDALQGSRQDLAVVLVAGLFDRDQDASWHQRVAGQLRATQDTTSQGRPEVLAGARERWALLFGSALTAGIVTTAETGRLTRQLRDLATRPAARSDAGPPPDVGPDRRHVVAPPSQDPAGDFWSGPAPPAGSPPGTTFGDDDDV